MPIWMQWILGSAALVAAVATLWTKAVKPLVKFVTLMSAMLPLLEELTTEFKNTPHAFEVLDEIVKQFRTDSGSSLRDVVNRLEVAAKENRASAEVLKVGVESVKQLAAQDRAQIQRQILLLDRLTVKVEDSAAGVGRIEHAAGNETKEGENRVTIIEQEVTSKE